MLRTLASLLCFVLGFGVSCFAIGRILPFQAVPNVRVKLNWLARHGDEFDIIFVGSSRVKNQILPSIFDRTAAENDCPVRSFNAGISAMTPPEDAVMLEQILQRPHRRLRWAIIELQTFSPGFNPALVGTERADYWHDAHRMWLLTRHAMADCAKASENASPKRSPASVFVDAFAAWSKHLQLFIRRSTNGGQGAARLGEKFLGGKNTADLRDAGPAGDGWNRGAVEKMMKDQDLSDYRRGLNILRERPPEIVEDSAAEESLRGMLELLRREGIEPILFVPPQLALSRFYPARIVSTGALFDLSDPAQYPELYDDANRCDATHLNLAGAELFTRLLANQFAEHLKRSPQ